MLAELLSIRFSDTAMLGRVSLCLCMCTLDAQVCIPLQGILLYQYISVVSKQNIEGPGAGSHNLIRQSPRSLPDL